MGIMSFLFGGRNPVEIIRRFEQEILEQHDQLFGIYLYAKGLLLLYSDQADVREATQSSFKEILERGNRAIQSAESLLQKAKSNPSYIGDIQRFRFPPTRGNPMLDEMTSRAHILVRTYSHMFPDRPRYDELSEDEHKALIYAASQQL
ncbi:MAG: hypothetical protein KA142_06745 [Chromatiaceae bacterium]|mgnify:FL=1|jgi:hypothetical protein|nr:hypothetical protein [Chromatiaceae bacterium]